MYITGMLPVIGSTEAREGIGIAFSETICVVAGLSEARPEVDDMCAALSKTLCELEPPTLAHMSPRAARMGRCMWCWMTWLSDTVTWSLLIFEIASRFWAFHWAPTTSIESVGEDSGIDTP